MASAANEEMFQGLVGRVIRRLEQDKHLDGFTNDELVYILDRTCEHLKPMKALVEMKAPLVIFGDIHGQLADLQRFLNLVGRPPKTRLLCLGDYVDRCRHSMEVTMLLFCYQLRFPKDITLLRGNHECAKMNRGYGFYEECRRKRNVFIWKKFQRCFNELPLCALVNKRIMAMHGGISPDIKSWDSLKKLQKPRNTQECDVGIPLDLMWADPTQDTCGKGWQYNKIRNASWMFGNDVIREFCDLLDLDLIVRAHEVTPDGHQFAGDKNEVCTVFSAPNYCGVDGNCASIMKVSENLEISFVTLKPKLDLNALTAEKMAELAKQNHQEVKSPMPLGHKTISPPQNANSKDGAQTPKDSRSTDGNPTPPATPARTPPRARDQGENHLILKIPLNVVGNGPFAMESSSSSSAESGTSSSSVTETTQKSSIASQPQPQTLPAKPQPTPAQPQPTPVQSQSIPAKPQPVPVQSQPIPAKSPAKPIPAPPKAQPTPAPSQTPAKASSTASSGQPCLSDASLTSLGSSAYNSTKSSV